MAFGSIVEGFSLSHAQILDGATAFLTAYAQATPSDTQDVYGVNSASLDPDVDDFQNEGDDVTLSDWSWLNFAELEVQAGYVSFPLIATLTGRTVSSGTTGGKAYFDLALWHENDFNIAPKPMILKMPSKDKDGNIADFVIGLYRVQFGPVTFDGPEFKEGLKVNYNGKVLYSLKDETGVAFTDGKKRCGRLLAIER